MLVKIISTILKDTYTTDDLIDRLGHMRTYYNQRLFSKNKNVTMDDILGGNCDFSTINILKQWQKKFEEQNIQPLVVYEALDTIQEEVAGLPSVTLYVPVLFGDKYIVRFGKWFRENVQPNILMTLRVDPRTTGGCGIVWNDTYYDFSLHYFVQNKHKEIEEMFNKQMHG